MTKIIKIILLMFMILLNQLVTDKSFAIDYQEEARSISNSVDLNKAFTQESVNEVPAYEGDDVKQSNYYNNPNAMQSDSNAQIQDSQSADIVNDVFYKSPQFTVNSNEEWLENSQYAQENPADFISINSSKDEIVTLFFRLESGFGRGGLGTERSKSRSKY